MASWSDVRRLALKLPEVTEGCASANRAWNVRGKAFVWERPLGKKDRAQLGDGAPDGAILGARTSDLEMKEMLLARDPGVYFTTPHFDGYPAVLVRLSRITASELKDLTAEAWLATAPPALAQRYLADRAPARPVPRR